LSCSGKFHSQTSLKRSVRVARHDPPNGRSRGITRAVIVGAPFPVVLALIVGLLDLIPPDRLLDRGDHRHPDHARGRRRRSGRGHFLVILVYQ
jgi:hypothetical protein